MTTSVITISNEQAAELRMIIYRNKTFTANKIHDLLHKQATKYIAYTSNQRLPINTAITSLKNCLTKKKIKLKDYVWLLIGMIYAKENSSRIYSYKDVIYVFSILESNNLPFDKINSLIQSLPNLPEEFKDLNFPLIKENQKVEDLDVSINKAHKSPKINNNNEFKTENDSQTKQSDADSEKKSISENTDKRKNEQSKSENTAEENSSRNVVVNNIDNSINSTSTLNDNSKIINKTTNNNIWQIHLFNKKYVVLFVAILIAILVTIFQERIITFFQKEQPIFSMNDNRYKILILPFNEKCGEVDVGQEIKNRLLSLNESDSLNLNVYYFHDFAVQENPIDTNISEYYTEIKNFNNADHIIYGDYFGRDCTEKDSDAFCINFITDNEKHLGKFEHSNLLKIRKGNLQGEIDEIVYWQAVISSLSKPNQANKTLRIIENALKKTGIKNKISFNILKAHLIKDQKKSIKLIETTLIGASKNNANFHKALIILQEKQLDYYTQNKLTSKIDSLEQHIENYITKYPKNSFGYIAKINFMIRSGKMDFNDLFMEILFSYRPSVNTNIPPTHYGYKFNHISQMPNEVFEDVISAITYLYSYSCFNQQCAEIKYEIEKQHTRYYRWKYPNKPLKENTSIPTKYLSPKLLISSAITKFKTYQQIPKEELKHTDKGILKDAWYCTDICIRLNSSYTEAYYVRARIAKELGYYNNAISDIQFFLKSFPDNLRGNILLFALYQDTQNLNQHRQFDKLKKIDPLWNTSSVRKDLNAHLNMILDFAITPSKSYWEFHFIIDKYGVVFDGGK